jgi:uncharacterized protein YcaQ
MTLDELRRYAVRRTLFRPTTLERAIEKLGFVQADPIRAPARAQDLTLRHRVRNYRVGDLERCYPDLEIEEDFFVNYGFLSRAAHALMHPRGGPLPWSRSRGKHVGALLAFVRERGAVHPREVDDHFSHGRVTNFWGGSSNATTHLMEMMHYRGLLRVVKRDRGIRIYTAHEHPPRASDAAARRVQLDALVDLALQPYAPLTTRGLALLVNRLRYGAPHLRGDLRAALQRAKSRLAHVRIDGIDWYWPAGERTSVDVDDNVRLLSPFDPIVWDRGRFEILWGWAYRFEAYTPLPKRKLGYYALPLLWRDRVIGWGNVSVKDGALSVELGFVTKRPSGPVFAGALEAELDRMRRFLRPDRRPVA